MTLLTKTNAISSINSNHIYKKKSCILDPYREFNDSQDFHVTTAGNQDNSWLRDDHMQRYRPNQKLDTSILWRQLWNCDPTTKRCPTKVCHIHWPTSSCAVFVFYFWTWNTIKTNTMNTFGQQIVFPSNWRSIYRMHHNHSIPNISSLLCYWTVLYWL